MKMMRDACAALVAVVLGGACSGDIGLAPSREPVAPAPSLGPAGGAGGTAGTVGTAGAVGGPAEMAGGAGGAPAPVAICQERGRPRPSRVWRLNERQFRNSVRALWLRLGGATGAQADPTQGIRVGLERAGGGEQFSTRAAALTLSEAAFGDLRAAVATLSARLVTDLGDKACTQAPDFDACLGALVGRAGEVLFRRPLAADEVKRYVTLARSHPDPARSELVRVALEALLLSPHFLFRTELGDAGGRLTGFELAAALSLSLLDEPPDEPLLALARADRLGDPATLREQVRRLFALAVAQGTASPVVAFFGEYLHFIDVDAVDKSAKLYPFHDATLLLDDANRLTAHVLQTAAGERFLERLLLTDEVFVRAQTAQSYALKGVRASEPVRQAQAGRAGVLTHPAWLVAHSQPERNDAIKRGRLVRERLLCQAIPAITVEEVPPLATDVPLREAMVQHRSDPRCTSCHALMDPLGLAFEGFDHLGRPAGAVSTAGDLTSVDEPALGGAFASLPEMLTRIARSRTAARCLASHSFEFFAGAPAPEGSCALESAASEYARTGGSYVEMLASLFGSPAFTARAR